MGNIFCPSCGFGRSWLLRREKRKCKRCRKEFSLMKYPVQGFRISEEQWRAAIGTFIRERVLLRVAAEAGVSRKTGQRITHLLRRKMTDDRPGLFFGVTEMDETYIGGQRKNKRLHIRRIRGKSGHGTDKLPIVGLFSRGSGKVFVVVEPKKLDVKFIFSMIGERVAPGSRILTD